MHKSLLSALLCISLCAGGAVALSGCENKAATGSSAATEEDTTTTASAKALKGIQVEDVKVGDGAVAQKGDTVSVNYLGTLASNGKKFDSSYDRNEPFTFKLGSGQVIDGWDKGIVGMKVGGKRILTISPEKAYGPNGYPPVIPPNATLKFEVELVDVAE